MDKDHKLMESDKEPLSFGRYLQAIRLEKKISLEQVSQQTRIGIGNLLLIEQEDHDQLPAEVYVKGFLRAYANSIGADGDEVIRRYGSRLDVVQKISESEPPSIRTVRRSWWKLLFSLVVFVCIISGSIFAVILLHQSPAENDSNSAIEDSSNAVEEMADTKKNQTDTEKNQTDTAEKQDDNLPQAEKQDFDADLEAIETVPDKFLLHVTAVEETWLKVIMDEKAPTEYILKSGDQIDLEANVGFNLLIGNAGGLNITLNDKPVFIPGKSGDVVTIELP
jgi:cytoskeletal protein RodZ